MIVVLSGEGPSDLGCCANAQGQCTMPDFRIGPMTVLIDKLIEDRLHYSIRDATPESYRYISEARLTQLDKERAVTPRKVSLPGKNKAQETAYYHINAWMLGQEAFRLAIEENDQAIAVLFRDTDGTRSTVKGLWDRKWQSMTGGFNRSQLSVRGVPMLPRPKSEAWMLCAAKNPPYQHGHQLEALSGNDDAPGSAKALLDRALDGASSTIQQVEWLDTHGFDHAAAAAQMPSFNQFKGRLTLALDDLILNPLAGTL